MHKQIISSAERCYSAHSPVIAVATDSLIDKFDFIPNIKKIRLPRVDNIHFTPYVSVIPFQILSLRLAQKKGYNVDCPRNLAKCITTR